MCDMARQHALVVIINCHVPHGTRVKEVVTQVRMQYVGAMEEGPVIVVGDFNHDPTGRARRRIWTEK